MSMPVPNALPRKRRRERGIALIMVTVAIAILTAVSTEFVFNSRVDLQMAVNARDEIRAYYLAKSGLGMARLLLKFQGQLNNLKLPDLSGLLRQFTGALAGGAAPTSAPTSMSIQLWKMAKIDCYMLQGLINEGAGSTAQETKVGSKGKFSFDDEFPEVAGKQKQRSFGTFEGCFSAQIEDEEAKINLNKLTSLGVDSRAAQTLLMNLFGDKRFEFLFERADSNGVKITPEDQINAIRDWIDEDQTQSAFNRSSTNEAFSQSGSDENGQYDRNTPRYHAKNAYFDSLDELYMVHGVNDRFMAAFRDRLTVYPDANSKINVNSDDPMILYMAILSVADPVRPDPLLRDPAFIDSLISKIRQARMFAMLGMSVADFIDVVERAGIRVDPIVKARPTDNRFVSNSSKNFTIKAVGEAGSVQKTLTAVVRIDNGMGRLLYWREE